MVPGTQQCVCPSIEVTPAVTWRNFQKSKDKKNTQNSIPRDLFEKHKRDHSQKVEAPKSEFQIKFNLHTPFPKLLVVHPVDVDLSLTDYFMLGGLHAQVYIQNQATAYPQGMCISKATEIKVVADKVCPCLPIWHAAKKKSFKLCYYEEMPSRKMNVEVMNFSRNYSSLFSGKRFFML